MATTAINPSQTILLKGIGKGYFNTVTNKFVEITSGQSIKLDVNATLEDVYAGDSLFPKYTYISKKEGSIEIDVADFSLSQLNISQMTSSVSTGVKKLQRVIKKNTDTSLGTYTGVSDVKCIAPDGTLMTIVDETPMSATEVEVTSDGAITFGTGAQTGEYVFWFKADATGAATQSNFLKNAMPEVAEFAWTLTTEDEDGAQYQIDIYAPRVRGDGKFSIDSSRDKASSPKITVKILDPGDGNDNFCTITVTKLA